MYHEHDAVNASTAGDPGGRLARASSEHLPDPLPRGLHVPSSLAGRAAAPDELIAAADPYGEQAQTLRDLQTEVAESFPGSTINRPIAIVSPDRGDGRSYLAANLAISFSRTARTLLVDADMHSPRVHRMFGLPRAVGLAELLDGDFQCEAIHPVQGLPGLHVLGAGLGDGPPLERLHGANFGFFLEEVARKFDVVIVDTPAACNGSDARVIAGRTRAALLLGRLGHSRLRNLKELMERLDRSRTVVTGMVLNAH